MSLYPPFYEEELVKRGEPCRVRTDSIYLIVPTLPAWERELTAPAVTERRAPKDRLPRRSVGAIYKPLDPVHIRLFGANTKALQVNLVPHLIQL